MKITLEDKYRVITIDSKESCEAMSDLVVNLLVPMLLAMGYHPDLVKEAFGEDDEDH